MRTFSCVLTLPALALAATAGVTLQELADCPESVVAEPPPPPTGCPDNLELYSPTDTDPANPTELTGCPVVVGGIADETTSVYFKLYRPSADARLMYTWNWGAFKPPRVCHDAGERR